MPEPEAGPPSRTSSSRPRLVWFLFVLYCAIAAQSIVINTRGYTVVAGRHIPLTGVVLERIVSIAVLLLELTGVIELFRLRSAAIACFTAALLARAMMTIHYLSLLHRHMLLIAAALVFILAVDALLLFFAARLKRNGKLQSGF